VSAPRGSVVIPAHDEAAVIDRTLSRLLACDGADGWQVVVVCNGCRDDTAQRARTHGVGVLEIKTASKVAALNAGDAHVQAFPRLYLDADVVLSPGALDDVHATLATPEPRVTAPALRVELSGAHPLVRSFYRTYLALPYLRDGLVGAGCYALNAAGRARFGRFPELTADDLFVQGCFAADERRTSSASSFEVRAPRTLRGLLAVRTRTYLGNAEAVQAGLAGSMAASRSGSLAALAALVRADPRRALDALVYVAINLLAQRRARRRGTAGAWLRDESSRR